MTRRDYEWMACVEVYDLVCRKNVGLSVIDVCPRLLERGWWGIWTTKVAQRWDGSFKLRLEIVKVDYWTGPDRGGRKKQQER